jgi:hypothetical protein
MKFADATNLNRKSGVAKWRDLLCARPGPQQPMKAQLNVWAKVGKLSGIS